ncbi:MAG: glycosyltransferase family 8 protein, partial [Candidatus Gastranaerophilales bacterium]|nr:glycosyltransferase family 8 protein [Candidatus Gastranaerophilales bacterium]
MHEYNICYSLDSTYTEQLAVSITSILKNADTEDNVNFYILDGGLTNKDKSEIKSLKNIKNFNIEYIPVNSSDFVSCPLLREKNSDFKDYHVTLPTYYRFKLPEFITNLDKILYLDCDVIVRCSLKKLYNTDLKDKAAAMVLDAESEKESERLNLKNYFNAGVMLINLEFWRQCGIEKKLFDFAGENKEKILWQDQDIINCVLSDNIIKLNNSWNFQYFLYDNINDGLLADCRILHLAGKFKPWLLPFENSVYDEYYHYLSFTSKANKVFEYKRNAFGKFLKNNTGGNSADILLIASNEDIQKAYHTVDESYNYTKRQIANITATTDEKISKIYDEISKNYEYTKGTVNDTKIELTINTDKKLDDVYQEI